MDINDLRSLVTLIGLALFVGLMVWTWRPSGRGPNAEAAELPFAEDHATRSAGPHASAGTPQQGALQ